ncbi:TAXI family TRAP transporter solute-binding subunit [Bacillus sp. Marseille-P3661]|uniref:TAXI family TRAP transporter solute-binding subunit n=1 Tax=Bacillus sp. Marseille-P3661 TaxID=1936234 RepID=UPI000C85E194|nr:TAXI family TRAP transporter solute-binding subunit [Bacillus sp. Marseille-P3661]
MKKGISKKLLLFIFVIMLALAGCSQSASEGAPSNEGDSSSSSSGGSTALKMATLAQGGAWYVYGATMAELLHKNVEQIERVDVLPYSGGLGNIKVVDQGEAELGLTFTLNNRWAVDGSVAYDKKYEDLRVLVGGLDKYYVGILMSNSFIEKHGIESIADIKTKEIPVRLLTLNKGSQGEYAAMQIMEAYGMDYETIQSYGGSVEHTSFDVVKTQIQDGKADMFIQVMTEGHPTFAEIALQTPVTFMDVEDEYRDKLKQFGYAKTVFPAGIFEGQDKEIQALGLTTTLVTTADLSEDLAYEITKTLAENTDALAAGHAGLSVYDPQAGITEDATGGVELHPGAAKYYKEQGWIE